jgi:transcriptional antiterminator
MGIGKMFTGYRWDMRLTDKEIIRAVAQLQRPCTQEELAQHLGCSRRTVIRSLKRLKGVINAVGSGNGIPYRYEIAYHLLPDDLRTELGHNGNNGSHANPL